jgi:hypothetical protein
MISIGLNLILGLMLFCALVLGMRLDRKLRALKASHLDFAKAVSELDGAALRTEANLAALRASAEAQRGELASRIDQARIACQRLEQLTAAAESVAERPLALTERAPPAPREPVRRETVLRDAHVSELRPAAAPVRSRAMIDDDLFEAAPARPQLAAVGGGRR